MSYCPILLCVLLSIVSAISVKPPIPDHGLAKRQADPQPGQLRNFQVSEPVLVPEGSSNEYGCIYHMTLMEHTFAYSYGAPFVGNYTPPPCDFNRVVINFTVTSAGRQFDRLALMYLGDTEVFRTSTAEPTSYGIIWNYMKEMQMYNALWKEPQKLIFDLGNLINDIYTGPFATTLTATFFTVPDSPATADIVLPISTRASAENSPSVFSVPDQNASVGYVLPNNISRAVVSLSACGQIGEEFWYTNAPNSNVNTFPDTAGTLPGQGTFREVQLLIDGQLAGVSWPFPVIFTGGVVPGLWRPIAAIDAYDLRQAEIDITPWLGYLLDGGTHNFEIRVASVNDNGQGEATISESPGQYWLVSGSIFLFEDSSSTTTTGSMPTIDISPVDLTFSSSYTQDPNGANDTLTYNTQARRSISISSTITTGNGTSKQVAWSQDLSYSNYNHLTDYGYTQFTDQLIEGSDVSTGPDAFSHTYSYPLTINSTYMYTNNGQNLFLSAELNHGKLFTTMGNPVLPSGLQNFDTSTNTNTPTTFSLSGGDGGQTQQLSAGAVSGYLDGERLQGTILNTTQVGTAQYQSIGSTATTFGTTEQWFSFNGIGSSGGGGINAEMYTRHVRAVNSTVVEDDQTFIGRNVGGDGTVLRQQRPGEFLTVQSNTGGGVRQFIGRGPGRSGRDSGS